jgi:hypothetical protein
MPEFSSAQVALILLGFAPGSLLGILVAYWYYQAIRLARARYVMPQRRAHHHVPAIGLALLAQGNGQAPPRTEPRERREPLAPGLNEYGEVLNPHEL